MLSYLKIGGREALKRILTGERILVNTIDRKAHLQGSIRNGDKSELVEYQIVEAFIKYGILEPVDGKEHTVGLHLYKCSIKLQIEVVSLI